LNIQFQHSNILWGLAILPICIVYWLHLRNRQKKHILLLGEIVFVKQLISTNYFQQSAKTYWLLTASICCLIIAIADPSVKGKALAPLTDGNNVVVALDVSKSMLSADVAPNRLVNAKWVIENLVTTQIVEHIGLVLFAGEAFIQMPVTNDKEAIPLFLANISTDAVSAQGTNISEALTTAIKALDNNRAAKKTIILLSDGENHNANIDEVIGELVTNQIRVITIGIGTIAGANIIDEATNDAKRDVNGAAIISKLEVSDLQNIAKETNGAYIAFKNPNQVLQALKPLLQTNILNSSQATNYSQISLMQFPALLAICCLLILIVPSLHNLKKSIGKILPLFLAAQFIITNVHSQNNNQLLHEANKMLQAKSIDNAINLYKKVLIKDPKNEIATYNLGNAFLLKKQYALAANTYSSIYTNTNASAQIKANTYYNQAYAYAKNNELPEAINALKKCLLLNPEDNDARENLQFLLNKTNKQKQPDKQPTPKKNDLLNEKLKQLKEEERQLFKQTNKPKTATGNNEKDW